MTQIKTAANRPVLTSDNNGHNLYNAQLAPKWKRKMVNENLTDLIISAGLCLISAGLTS